LQPAARYGVYPVAELAIENININKINDLYHIEFVDIFVSI
jgi:hypothetical protein